MTAKPNNTEFITQLLCFTILIVSVTAFDHWMDYKYKSIPECTIPDVYETSEWGSCTNGVRQRTLIVKDHSHCREAGRVQSPELFMSCR